MNSNQVSSSQAQAVTISLVVIATICAVAAAVAVRSVLVPTLLATLLALALAPVVSLLERIRLPSALAAAVTVLTAAGAIVAVSIVAAPRFDAFVEEIPGFLEKLGRNVRSFEASLREVGDATEAIGTMVGDHSGQTDAQPVKIAGDSPARFLLKSGPVAATVRVIKAARAAEWVILASFDPRLVA
ncbi:MAG: AI-2E family transporter, partial [Parvularculaceae bacterium]